MVRVKLFSDCPLMKKTDARGFMNMYSGKNVSYVTNKLWFAKHVRTLSVPCLNLVRAAPVRQHRWKESERLAARPNWRAHWWHIALIRLALHPL